MSKEWYRRSTWSDNDAKEFENKLMRANTENRPQYLRIQAYHLAEASLHIPSLILLDRLLIEYPDDNQIAQAQYQRAEILLQLNRIEEAIAAYRQAMDVQRKNPNVKTEAYLGFAWFVANTSHTSLFDEALEVLKEFGGDEAFPVGQFKYFESLAMIHAAKGNMTVASMHAKSALLAKDTKESKFRYHRNLGLVHDVDPTMIERLNIIAAS
jgi:tetratricopeptide (TPR) repeat protein